MSDNITKRVGLGTAYGFAKAGGYEGTVAEFTELLGNIAIDLARIENLSVTVTTLPAGSQATASLNGSVLSLGIPKGDKGDKGTTGDTGSPAGFGTVSATVDANIGTPSVEVTASGSDTAKNFAFAFHNLKGQKGDKGDTGEVSEAELAEALEDFSANGTVANAEQLTTDIRANDQTPYLFRTAGGSVDIGDREYINGIVGGTVAFNQLAQGIGTNTNDGITTEYDSTTHKFKITNNSRTFNYSSGSFRGAFTGANTTVANHKYLMLTSPSITGVKFANSAGVEIMSNVWTSDGNSICLRVTSSYDFVNTHPVGDITTFYVGIHDLTQMFGSTIADYIYSLEQANAGAGVAFFKTLFPKPYYAYNAGELMSVKALRHITRGFNAWDEDVQHGYYSQYGVFYPSSGYVASKKIPILPSTVYNITSLSGYLGRICFYDKDEIFISTLVGYAADNTIKYAFTTPSKAYYMTFDMKSGYGGTYKNDICINLSWDGERDGEYEPYDAHVYELDPDLELRGIPKLSAGNDLYYDGDIYEPDGTVTRKYGIVDLGTLDWSYVEATHAFRTYGISDLIDPNATSVLCQKYPCYYDTDWHTLDKLITTWASYKIGNIIVKDTAYSDAATFKSAMSGVYLVYPLKTSTTETADPYTSPQIVNDFGTEEFVISNTVAVPIPVGHNTDYPINLKAKLEMAPNSPDGDGDYIVRQTNGTNEYVSIANNATIQNILTRLEALEG